MVHSTRTRDLAAPAPTPSDDRVMPREGGELDADVADARLEITVSHGSFEEADYALMVGSYEDEPLSGAERFLDRQLNGVLSASYEAGSYPGPLGESSLFVSPHPEVHRRTTPPGAYVVGLGRSAELNRSRVRHAVSRALVDRCLQLENAPPDHSSDEIREVGVSSTLLGVRNADGIPVSESVAGIVDGILDANRSLVRYEDARARAGSPTSSPVRVVELELIERFGDRADLSAMVVRSLPDALARGGHALAPVDDIVVRRKRGGLPAGAALVDAPQDWRRFSILARTPTDAEVEPDPATLTFDVSFLGGDARADRIAHQLDRVVVDALASRLSVHTSDAASAATLYDLLVPEQMRDRFQSASSVQLIVDETTANYPWELLSAPGERGRGALAGRGSIVRQFSESSTRRLVVRRARRGNALVIGAGRVPARSPLPGAHREADLAAQLLCTRLGPKAVQVLHDEHQPMATVDLINALDGDHQIVHIASHGEYEEGNPAATGALLNDEFRLRVETVRQLRHVPDLVFLNCCLLGRVGTARMAAGLAREFIAIGTRAVIACGWPVGDDNAEVFASTFYGRFLDGAAFADAVAAARDACLLSGGRETWAAYQCYGDPLLLLEGAAGRPTVRESDPVSVEDLLRRLESLEIRASDLGRPGTGTLRRRRAELFSSLGRFAGWAARIGLVPPKGDSDRDERDAVAVQRRLARVAAELGEYRWAAERYLSLVAAPGGADDEAAPTLRRRWSNAEDLQQASNCLSRAAQHDARVAPDGAAAGQLRAELDQAVSLARLAVRVTDESESYGVLGGALKRLATVVAEGREERIRAAAHAYEHESDGSGDDRSYNRTIAAQLASLVSPSVIEPPSDDVRPGPPALRRIDGRTQHHAQYWDAARVGDRLLTQLLARRCADEPAEVAGAMVEAYERAFAGRSTWRERASSLDHLRDLRDLLPGPDDRRQLLVAAVEALDRWELDNVDRA